MCPIVWHKLQFQIPTSKTFCIYFSTSTNILVYSSNIGILPTLEQLWFLSCTVVSYTAAFDTFYNVTYLDIDIVTVVS